MSALEQPKLGDDGLPIPNLPLLRKVLDLIDTEPNRWDQGNWVVESECGTVGCIAGHAVALTEGVVATDGINPDECLYPASQRDWYIAGRDALGLTPAESYHLFAAHNERADVQRYAEAIAARGGERL